MNRQAHRCLRGWVMALLLWAGWGGMASAETQDVTISHASPGGVFWRLLLGDDRLWDWRSGQLGYDAGNLSHNAALHRDPTDYFLDPSEDSFFSRLWTRELDALELWFARAWDKNIVHANAVADRRNPHAPHPLLDPSSLSMFENLDSWRLTIGRPDKHPTIGDLALRRAAHPEDGDSGEGYGYAGANVGLRSFLFGSFEGDLYNMARAVNGQDINYNPGHAVGIGGWEPGTPSGALVVQDDLRLGGLNERLGQSDSIVRGILNVRPAGPSNAPYTPCSEGIRPLPDVANGDNTQPSSCSGYLSSFADAGDPGDPWSNPPWQPQRYTPNRTPVQVRDRSGFEALVTQGGGADLGKEAAEFVVDRNRLFVHGYDFSGNANKSEPQGQALDFDVWLGPLPGARMTGIASTANLRDIKLRTQEIVVQSLWSGRALKPYGITLGAEYDPAITGEDVDGPQNNQDGGVPNPYRGERRYAWPFGATKVARNASTTTDAVINVEVTCPYIRSGTHPTYYINYWALTGCSQEIASGAPRAIPQGTTAFRTFTGDGDANPFNDTWWYSKPDDQMWSETQFVDVPANTVGCRATFSNPSRENGTFAVYAHCSATGRTRMAPGGPLVPPGMDYVDEP